MTKLHEIYRCNVCGNIVEMVHASVGELICCGQKMELLAANSDDSAATEKHVPVIEKTATGVRVKIGEVPHPMTPDHFIEWIEILADGKSFKKFLQPGDAPEAEFCISADEITAREYCNLHGLWQNN